MFACLIYIQIPDLLMFCLRAFIAMVCISCVFLRAEPGYAQAEGEWRAMLPDGEAANQRTNTDAATPEIVPLEIEKGAMRASHEGSFPPIRLGSILVDSDRKIDHAMFDAVIEPHLGKVVTPEELAALALQIADAARANGMILASAHVPAQEVELGIVRIMLQVGVIADVRIEGSDNRALKGIFASLIGQPVFAGDIERKLVLAGDIPQIVVRAAEIVTENGGQILLIKAEERKPLRGRLALDNHGSANIGPLRARLSVEAVSLLDDSDFANVTFRANPADPGELSAASMTYGIALGNNGTRAEFSGAWSKSAYGGENLGQRNGRSVYGAIGVSHPLRRSRTSSLWLDGQFEYLKIDQDVFGATLQSDTVVTMSAGLSASLKTGGGWLRAGTQLRRGLGIFGATGRNDPLASKFNADGEFVSARAWANWSGEVADDLTVRVAVTGQLASEPLLSSEEAGIGGAFVGRAFDFYERAGDRGAAAFAEIGYVVTNPTRWLKRIQPYMFIDGGTVDDVGIGFADGALVSAGGGVRGVLGPLDVQIETAFPVYASPDWGRASSPRLNFQLGVDF